VEPPAIREGFRELLSHPSRREDSVPRFDLDDLIQLDRGRVHASIYTDPEIFREEMQRIFFTTWVFIGHESEIPRPGSFKTTYIGNVPLILTRTDDGAFHVLVNRCVHRGATVCQLERGEAKAFRCEYHAWTYNTAGDLIGISRPDGYSENERAQLPGGLARAPRVASCAGMIFASFSETGISLAEHLGPAARYLENWAALSPSGTVDVSGGTWKTSYRGNWKIQVEGSNEGYHPDFLHRIAGLVNERNAAANATSFTLSKNHALDLGHGHNLMEHPPATASFRHETADYLAQLEARLGKARAEEVIAKTFRLLVFPNLTISTEQIRVVRPIAVDQTEVYQYHVRVPGAPDDVNLSRVRKHVDFAGPAGNGSPDDFETFERIQEGLGSMQWAGALPWIWFNRGLESEGRRDDGVRTGATSGEVQQRAIYYEWKRLMAGSPNAPAPGALVAGLVG
jgi:phenylpropionate dioxygenase-like ring-hydroxylating dioxygenase large terminal subunit